MKRQLLAFFGIALLLILSVPAMASHFAAVDLQVTYIGKDPDGCGEPEYKYEVLLIIYGACERGSQRVGENQSIIYWSDNAGPVLGKETSVPLTVLDNPFDKNPISGAPPYNGFIVHELCPNFSDSNACLITDNADKYPGFRRWTYRAEITLPVAQTDWKFAWTSSARNGGITNLANPGSTALYVEAGINNVAQYNISTPRFTSNPLPYLCVNGRTEYLNGPRNIMKRDTTVRLITTPQIPLNGKNNPLAYAPGFSPNNPISSSTGYFVDPSTGTASFTGTQTGFFVLAFRLDQVRRDQEGVDQSLSYTMRDVQVTILNCDKEPPTIDTIPQDLTNATWRPVSDRDSGIYVCPGSELSFNVRANTPTVGNKLWIISNNKEEIPGSSFSVSGEGTENPVGTFTWTPGPADIGDYTLIFSAEDSSCRPDQPIILKKPVAFLVRVTPGINAGDSQLYCLNSGKEMQLYVSETHNALLRVQWTNIDGSAPIGMDDPTSIAPRVVPPKGATLLQYRVSTPDLAGSCQTSDEVKLQADLSDTITIAPKEAVQVRCNAEFLQLDAIFKGTKPLKNFPCGITKPNEDSVIREIEMGGSLAMGKGAVYDTLGNTTPFLPNATRSSKQQFMITKQERAAYGMLPGTIRGIVLDAFEAKEPTYEYSNFTISLKCTPKTELSRDTFERDLVTVFSKEKMTIPQGLNEFMFDNAYNWDSSQNLIIEICYTDNATVLPCDPPIFKFVATNYLSRLLYYPLDGNQNPDPTVTDVCNTIVGPLREYYNRPLVIFKYNIAPVAPIEFNWTPGTLLSDSTIQTPLAYVPKTQRYIVETKGGSSCRIYDTIDVYIPDNHYSVAPGDTSVCYGTDAIMTVEGGFYYRWFEYTEHGEYIPATTVDCNTCKTVRARPFESTHYKIAVFDSVFCLDTVDAWVTVLPRPEVKLLTGDTILKYGQSIPLLATGARQYNWMPSSSLSTPNTSSPIATPTEPTTYIVTGIGSNGCRSFDTVEVDIDYRDNILVPTAFSPNGDGRNDLFRVANLTFQQIMEFRVFNRWGQEVFSTHDARTGWDGTWKGVDQPIDTYRYIIRVGFPDGLVETYKGDVTLIR